MILNALGIAAGLLLMAQPALAVDDCLGTTPRLHFTSKTANTEYIRTQSSAALKEMQGGAPSGSAVGGLGGGEIGFKIQTHFEITETGSYACVRLKNVGIEFYAYPSIHLASDLNRSSCEYNAVMAHERKHVSELRKFVREYSPKTQSAIQQLLYAMDTAIGPINKSEISKAQKKLQSDLSNYLNTYQSKIMPTLRARQKQIDSPAEYARVTAQCNDWGNKLGGAQ